MIFKCVIIFYSVVQISKHTGGIGQSVGNVTRKLAIAIVKKKTQKLDVVEPTVICIRTGYVCVCVCAHHVGLHHCGRLIKHRTILIIFPLDSYH